MGFGINLLKGAAEGIVGGAISQGMGMLGNWITGNGRKERKHQQAMMDKQFANEKEMMGLQNQYNTAAGAQNQEYAKEMNALQYGQNKEMNAINFEQQKAMFDKQSEYMSPENQKERLKEAGLNPALVYGLGAQGAGGTSSGGGSGASGGAGSQQGVSNTGTQAVAMGLQAKGLESQIRLNEAQARKLDAEAMKTAGVDVIKSGAEGKAAGVNADQIVEATELLKQQQLSEESKRKLNDAETAYKERVTDLQDAIENLTKAKEGETWFSAKAIEAAQWKTEQEAEKIIEETNGLEIDNSIKQRTKEYVIEQSKLNLQGTVAAITESMTRSKLNSQQLENLKTGVKDIINQIEVRTGEFRLNQVNVAEKIKGMWKQIGISETELGQKQTRLISDIIIQSVNAIGKIIGK